MKLSHLPILLFVVLLLCSCTALSGKQAATAPVAQSPKPLVIPVSKNWQLAEEPPKLSDERGRLPFQTEHSLQPAGASRPASPGGDLKIETDR